MAHSNDSVVIRAEAVDFGLFVKRLRRVRVLIVADPPDEYAAAGLARALTAARLTGCVVPARAPGRIATLADGAPRLLIGAAGAEHGPQATAAALAGAGFVSTEDVDPGLIRSAHARGVPVVPAVNDYPEVIAAARESVSVVRVDVSAPDEGADCVRRYTRLFPGLEFLPYGAIGPDELEGYLRLPSVPAVATTYVHDADPADVPRLAGELAAAAARV